MKNSIKRVCLFIVTFLAMTLFLSHVPVSAASVKLNKKYATLEVDAVIQLKITGTNSTVKWSTSDKKVAGVTKKGKVVAYKEGSATITATVGSSKYTCEVTVVDNNKEIENSEKPSSKGMPTLKDTDDYTVTGSYTYTTYGYQYLIYVVDAKKTIDAEIKLVIKDKNGNILDTCEDSISLTKGKKNYFKLSTESKYIDSKNKYTLTSKSSSSFWSGAEDAVKVTNYNKSGDNFYITVKQTKEDLGGFAQLKILFFNGDKLVNAEECFYSIYADDLEHKGDESVMSIWIYDVNYTSVEFYYQDR